MTLLAWSARDHPRIRGEHHALLESNGESRGSSPHTRGAPAGRPTTSNRTRIIPAYAGSTVFDNPGKDNVPGSSPHTRGAHQNQCDSRHEKGIIPAYAGSTPSGMRRRGILRDHPRIRGEHVGEGFVVVPAVGSSPHTRGAHSGAWRRRR